MWKDWAESIVKIKNIYFFSSQCVFSKYMHSIWELAYILTKVSVVGEWVKRLSGVECKIFNIFFFFSLFYFHNLSIKYESPFINTYTKASAVGRWVKRLSGVESKINNIYFFSLCVFSKNMHCIWELAYILSKASVVGRWVKRLSGGECKNK